MAIAKNTFSRSKQFSFFKSNWKHDLNHGGSLRKVRKGRKARPLSCSEPLHVVFKVNRDQICSLSLRTHRNFNLVQNILARYARRFFIKIEQVSVQADHIHCLVRTSRRCHFHYFFRVVAGQIAQQFQRQSFLRSKVTGTPSPTEKRRNQSTGKNMQEFSGTLRQIENRPAIRGEGALKLWMFRPFSRVVKGWKAYKIVRDYIQLNEKEALREITYKKDRLRGLSMFDWKILWNSAVSS